MVFYAIWLAIFLRETFGNVKTILYNKRPPTEVLAIMDIVGLLIAESCRRAKYRFISSIICTEIRFDARYRQWHFYLVPYVSPHTGSTLFLSCYTFENLRSLEPCISLGTFCRGSHSRALVSRWHHDNTQLAPNCRLETSLFYQSKRLRQPRPQNLINKNTFGVDLHTSCKCPVLNIQTNCPLHGPVQGPTAGACCSNHWP